MKKLLTSGIALLTISGLFACNNTKSNEDENGWKLVWEENFDTDGYINDSVWSKIPRGRFDWNHYMSDNDALFEVKDGNLVLWGIVNPDTINDPVPFITGGLYTKDKKAFGNGKLEVKAKLGNAQGAWPAIWLLPFNNEEWPWGGEIDIMERLNSDSVAYQTVHSHYTFDLGREENPKHGNTGKINVDDYNVYSVEMYKDSVVFAINDVPTLTYPRIETDLEGQFPFDRDFYLLVDMQLEGNWVGKADPEQLPVSMEIDWIKFYQKTEE